MQMSMLGFVLGPRPSTAVQLPIDATQHGGFAEVLRMVLNELGVPTSSIQYVVEGEPAPGGGLQGYTTVKLSFPASERVREFSRGTGFQFDDNIRMGVQQISREALRLVTSESRQYLEGTSFRLLPRALDYTRDMGQQYQEIIAAPHAEADLALKVCGLGLLAYDAYTLLMEQRVDSYRGLVTRAQEDRLNAMDDAKEWERAYHHTYGDTRLKEEKYRYEIAEKTKELQILTGRLLDTEYTLDWHTAKNLELEHDKVDLEYLLNFKAYKKKRKWMTVAGQRNIAYHLGRDLEREKKRAAHNSAHLTLALKEIEVLKDRLDCTLEAWKDSDADRVKEIEKLRAKLPNLRHRQLRKETYAGAPSHLDLSAWPPEGFQEPIETPEFCHARYLVGRLRKTPTQTQAESDLPPPTS